MPDFGAEAAKGGPVVDVSILPTGWLYLPDTWIFQDGKPGFKHWSPDFSFLVRHPSGRTIIFDLGMRKDLENNPLVIRQDYPTIEPWVPKDACDLLLEGPVHPKDIDAVILSHLHFDHTGDVTKFPSAEIIAGEGTAEATSPGWPTAQLSPFDGTVLTHPKFRELSKSNPGYGSLDMFPYAYDFFSDGSFYLLDAPGHMAGHQMGLARTGEKEWVVMGGDCCHHMDLLVENNRTISVVDGPNGQPGFHKDPKVAQESIEKLKKMRAYKNILTLLAHDASLQGKYPLYPATINGWSIREAQGFGQSRTI